MNTFERIYEVVRKIPKGHVATYGQIASYAGNPRMSRVVGYALHSNPDPEGIPCFRVVNRFGELSSAFVFGGINRQEELLTADGIEVVDGKVDLSVYQWNGK
ncbi:MAG: MGMT family protein [Clostridia bacterium]|nr:MGMT family protein [Clostridia bacterium]